MRGVVQFIVLVLLFTGCKLGDDRDVEYVKLEETDRVKVLVYNLSVQLVQESRESKISLSSLKGGIYIVNAWGNDEVRIELKVFKN